MYYITMNACMGMSCTFSSFSFRNTRVLYQDTNCFRPVWLTFPFICKTIWQCSPVFFPPLYFVEELSGKITFMGRKPLFTALSSFSFYFFKVYFCILYTHLGVIGVFLIIKEKKLLLHILQLLLKFSIFKKRMKKTFGFFFMRISYP